MVSTVPHKKIHERVIKILNSFTTDDYIEYTYCRMYDEIQAEMELGEFAGMDTCSVEGDTDGNN